MSEAQLRHSAEDYAQAFGDLFPTGPAWSRERGAPLDALLAGLSAVWERVDHRAADLLGREADPRTAIELLPEWERALGLPDPCLAEPLTIADRQRAVTERLSSEGGQSIAFFTALAARLGYTVRIIEHAPFMCGVSRVGDTRPTGDPGESFRWEVAPEMMRFVWTVKVVNPRLSWFRVGSGQVGVDPHLRIAIASDLECLFRRLRPAHTDVFFDYSGLAPFGPLAGTP